VLYEEGEQWIRMLVLRPCTSSHSSPTPHSNHCPYLIDLPPPSFLILQFIVHFAPHFFHCSCFGPCEPCFPLLVDFMNWCGWKLKPVIWYHLCFYPARWWDQKNIPKPHIIPTILCRVITQNSFNISCIMAKDFDHARVFFMIILPQDIIFCSIHVIWHGIFENPYWWILVKCYSKQS